MLTHRLVLAESHEGGSTGMDRDRVDIRLVSPERLDAARGPQVPHPGRPVHGPGDEGVDVLGVEAGVSNHTLTLPGLLQQANQIQQVQ